jgi:hypothetical protein
MMRAMLKPDATATIQPGKEQDSPSTKEQGASLHQDASHAAQAGSAQDPQKRPREFGGRDGPEPTRFGDWEKSGRCIDF